MSLTYFYCNLITVRCILSFYGRCPQVGPKSIRVWQSIFKVSGLDSLVGHTHTY